MRIIFLACEFAPEGKTGSIRPSKLVKYFKRANHDVEVISKEIDETKNIHEDLLKDIGFVQCHRIKINKFLPINDDGFWFFFYSFRVLFNRIKKFKPQYIFVSIPVFIPMISAVLLGKLFDVKVILDYRDLWAADPYTAKSTKDKVLRSIGRFIEPWAMRNAFMVNFISNAMKNDQIKLYGEISNATVVSTGFDNDDIKKIKDVVSHDLLVPGYKYFSHIGMLDHDMNIITIISLISKSRDMIMKNKIKFLFVGGKNNLIIPEFKDHEIYDLCVFVDTVDKKNALILTKLSDGVVILGSDSPQRLNRKVFECIACNTNVFYYGNNRSPTAKILRESNYRYIYDASTENEILHEGFCNFLNCTNRRVKLPYGIKKYEKKCISEEILRLMSIQL